MSSDVRDILDIEDSGQKKNVLSRESLLAKAEKKNIPKPGDTMKRPKNIPREVWGLQNTFKNELPPLIPADSGPIFKQPKANIGVGRVRPWAWVSFTNSARKDGLVLHHWRRKGEADPEADYKYAKYDKHVEVPSYTDEEYKTLLSNSKWSREKTDYLMELARRFDLRFVHMHDRWDEERFKPRPCIEDLKERYYELLMILDKHRGTKLSQGLRYDAEHEKKRKMQLELLYGRTREAVEEEEKLIAELKLIETRRREREKKKQDLQKLISQAENTVQEQEANDLANQNFLNSLSANQKRRASGAGVMAPGANAAVSSAELLTALTNAITAASASLNALSLISFPDMLRSQGVHLRSQNMKLPANLGQKKSRVIENFLSHFQIDPNPPATSDIVEAYNQLRGNILLLYDLRTAFLTCEYELQTARLRLETFAPEVPLPKNLSRAVECEEANMAIDSEVLSALKQADSKKTVLPRQSFGVPGALGAVGGQRTGMAMSPDERKRRESQSSNPRTGSCAPAHKKASKMV